MVRRYEQRDHGEFRTRRRVLDRYDAMAGWVATDGNAATATTRFSSVLDDLDAMVDWPLMTATRWNSTPDDPDRQRRRMAELLVRTEVPLSVITLLGAYSDAYADQVRRALAGHDLASRVVVRPAWYYGYERGR